MKRKRKEGKRKAGKAEGGIYFGGKEGEERKERGGRIKS